VFNLIGAGLRLCPIILKGVSMKIDPKTGKRVEPKTESKESEKKK